MIFGHIPAGRVDASVQFDRLQSYTQLAGIVSSQGRARSEMCFRKKYGLTDGVGSLCFDFRVHKCGKFSSGQMRQA